VLAPFAPFGMVDVLLAAFLVAAGRLDVPPRVGPTPHRAPCRRARERGQPAPNGPVAHRLPRVVEILEAAAASAAGEPRLVAVDIAQRRVDRDGAHDHGPGAVRPARVRGSGDGGVLRPARTGGGGRKAPARAHAPAKG